MALTYDFAKLKDSYTHMWSHMEINPSRLDVVRKQAQRIISYKNIYQSLEQKTNVPWYFIGLLHLRESNCNFHTHLHNGDPLSARTVHVPAGRPLTGTPPFSFEYSALDAIKQKGLDKITDWSIERIAYCLEKYNGFGYRYKGIPSAYLWASTNQYIKGKYIRDGVFDPNVVDTQLGAMAVLKVILDIEKIEKPTDHPTVEPELIDIIPNTPTADVPRPTNKEMRKKSRKFALIDILKWFGWGGGGAGVATKALDSANIVATKGYLDAFRAFFRDYGLELTIAACIGVAVITIMLQNYIKEDLVEGRYIPKE